MTSNPDGRTEPERTAPQTAEAGSQGSRDVGSSGPTSPDMQSPRPVSGDPGSHEMLSHDPRARNAVKHGLSARHVLAEERAAFAEALDRLTASYEPASRAEAALVARLAHLCVRSDRALRLESAAFAECIREDGTPNWAVFERLTSTIGRYDLQIGRALVKAKHELERIQAAREDGGVQAPTAIDFNW